MDPRTSLDLRAERKIIVLAAFDLQDPLRIVSRFMEIFTD
jgi:hypothetical protein